MVQRDVKALLPDNCREPVATDAFTGIDEIKKQVSIYFPISDWKAIQLEAARQNIPITVLCRKWIEPHLKRVREQAAEK